MIDKSIFTSALFYICLVFFFSACSDKKYIAQSQSIAEASWYYQDSVDFMINVEALPNTDAQLFDLSLDITHKKDYPFRNLYLNISEYDGETLNSRNTISLDVADASGQWLGKCKGQKCTYTTILRSNFSGSNFNTNRISISQYMRQSPLYGIEELTLYCSKKLKR